MFVQKRVEISGLEIPGVLFFRFEGAIKKLCQPSERLALNRDYPNLVLLGSQKSGTTTLHGAMNAHPEIFMCQPIKEPVFFFPEDRIIRRYKRNPGLSEVSGRSEVLNRFMKRGYKSENIFGESSTGYTIGDNSRRLEVPERMKSYGDDFRFIYLVRHPIKRLVSNYKHVSKGFPTFEGFLNSRAGQVGIATSSYAYQIEAYLEHFDISRFHFLRFDDLISDQNAVLQNVYQFLGLPPHEAEQPLHLNSSKARNLEPEPEEVTSDAMIMRAHETIVAETERFARLSGLDLSSWSLSLDDWRV